MPRPDEPASDPAVGSAPAEPSLPSPARERGGRGGLALAGWILAATAAPILAAILVRLFRRPLQSSSDLGEVVGVGSVSGMLILLIAGIRSGRLAGWVLGPPLGFALGILAQKAVYWPIVGGWSPRDAALLPMWGAGVGLAAGLASGSRRAMGVLLLTATALHFLGLWAWQAAPASSALQPFLQGNLRWLLESLPFIPVAIALVLGMPRRR